MWWWSQSSSLLTRPGEADRTGADACRVAYVLDADRHRVTGDAGTRCSAGRGGDLLDRFPFPGRRDPRAGVSRPDEWAAVRRERPHHPRSRTHSGHSSATRRCATGSRTSRREPPSSPRCLGGGHKVVPDDPHGRSGWRASGGRRPGASRASGRAVRPAIQCGHFQYPTPPLAAAASMTARGRDRPGPAGIRTSLRDDFAMGTGSSGPAVRRAINASQDASRQGHPHPPPGRGHPWLPGPDQLRQLQAFLLPVYSRDRAPCDRLDMADTPQLDRCQPSCAKPAHRPPCHRSTPAARPEFGERGRLRGTPRPARQPAVCGCSPTAIITAAPQRPARGEPFPASCTELLSVVCGVKILLCPGAELLQGGQ